MATEDARYRLSSQYRLWSFAPAKLVDLREKTNTLATNQIGARLVDIKSSSSTPNASSVSTPAAGDLPEFLTASEETLLLKFFTVELIRAAIFCELPTEVRATAAVFLKRFYITNSVMTYPPTDLLKTCLFFGGKAEGYFAKLSKLADKFPNTTEEEILAGEFLLCQGIRFAFDVRHPFRGLEGAILELRRHGQFDTKRIEDAHIRAREVLKFSSLVTDAYLHYTPSQIMLAGLSLADRGLAESIIDGTFDTHNGQSVPSDAITVQIKEKVTATVESCRELLSTELPERLQDFWGTPESQKLIRPLIKKLRKCRDPDRADLVALQRARREAAAKASSDKEKKEKPRPVGDSDVFGGLMDLNEAREAKRRKVAAATANADPFGGAL
ncbi:cyclin mcs2 [Plectosphaerella plurivora]|uniref:Cyclin mcs2 n=1 Tax=Plectosphaerella plurivora TaxID=936078 RepID=A0A9P8VJC1_9PEZI|nr:cyclin mcs2 [Plectosphaerella plurivora]